MRWLVGLLLLGACVESSLVERPLDAQEAIPWATYTIAPGAHDAHLIDRTPKNPIDGVVSVVGRDYALALDGSAIYELTAPTEPTDQLDWNKLPGLSDCGGVDLAIDGAMFGWRWRVDVTPPVLEITAYANEQGEHRWLPSPMVTLDAEDLAAAAPLHYRIVRRASDYTFSITGEVRQRPIAAAATLPRGCAGSELAPLAWASGLYFGGTSTAPHTVTARIHELAFDSMTDASPSEP